MLPADVAVFIVDAEVEPRRFLDLSRRSAIATLPESGRLELKPETSMSRTVQAIVEKDGSLRLLENVELRAGDRVLVTLHFGGPDRDETALLSETSLAADWERPEEDEAWSHLQS